MENASLVRQAVENHEIVVACAYGSKVSKEVTASLPPGFHARSYVAKFLDGRLVAVEAGLPEEVMASMLSME
jgi:hypothetical protein